ncbi:glycine hydroxymethyltransferase [Planomonospora sphaerica]|uniref:Glycine hydroxymethyltransferase n=1 Tax=Planomonospora sphaerica TaxID=161355 RepID=A0A171DNH1_9ACTN|nr:aminotransferase class I/II-fold pyridoxal phosphate-dependent enzyme [Planomonospora sphaerica]GAT70608.1 glycine hydroxymethyltransferase [Planomonospora sphaerica]
MEDGADEHSRIAPWAPPRARRRLAWLESALGGLDADGVAKAAGEALAGHLRRFGEDGIVLYAGTNTMSARARAACEPALASRPSMGWPGEKFQTGLEELDVLEVLAPLQVAAVMGGGFAEVRLQSATLANLACYTALARPGDTVAVLPEAAGGHASHHAQGAAGVRGLRVVDLPYDAGGFDVDHAALPGFLRAHRPALVVVGASLMLFPHDVSRIRAACDEVGALLVYDASHVAGLIAGKRFQRPLDEGAHVVTMSTYKSFGGPPGSAVVTRDEEIARRVSEAAYPGLTANYDASRLAPLAVTAAELAEDGPAYADRCLANATALAAALAGEGFAVVAAERGWTASHHVAVDAAAFGGGDEAARRLAAGGVFLSGIGLPGQAPGEPMRGLRIGTQEVTRRGLGPDAMRGIAVLARRLLIDAEDPAKVLPDAVALRRP